MNDDDRGVIRTGEEINARTPVRSKFSFKFSLKGFGKGGSEDLEEGIEGGEFLIIRLLFGDAVKFARKIEALMTAITNFPLGNAIAKGFERAGMFDHATEQSKVRSVVGAVSGW